MEGNVGRVESSAYGQDALNESREDVKDKAYVVKSFHVTDDCSAETYQTLDCLYSKLFFAIASGSGK